MPTKRLSKNEVTTEIAASTGLDKKTILAVMDSLRNLVIRELQKPNGEFVIPGLLKLKSVQKPATTDRPGINPFTKQPMTIKGKPASKKLKTSALKAFTDTVQ